MSDVTDLTPDEARRVILRAQGLIGADARKGGVHTMLRRLGAVQLDTISVLARSHELVAYARLGAVGRPAVERAYWHDPALSFEYWCHAACLLPIEHWPLYSFRRRAFRARKQRWHEVPDGVEKLLDQAREFGPLTTSDVGGAKNGGPWWDWSDSKIGLEWLLDIGELVCTRRVGWRRVYDLAERAVPPELLAEEPSDEECITRLTAIAGRSLGVANRTDLTDFIRVRGRFGEILDEALHSGAAGLVPVTVAGWPGKRGRPNAWADPAALAAEPRGRHRTTLVSPFDSLIWHRGRTERVFGFNYTLELYVPKHKRVHGYFTMPVLAGGRLIGRVDPAREGSTLVARRLSLEPGLSAGKWADAMREALWSAASWVGCDNVRVERADPPELLPLLNTP
ncbi:crosslink repair DNA glycosylase YcaQ family protein [Nonomuraea sp. NPDC049419]|uniref:winged helix-turn-helix domain-containing protein n=1 Tax=Nonomuraea sp. NPDC049419 TaxID=3155772 RepID=UPI00343FB464